MFMRLSNHVFEFSNDKCIIYFNMATGISGNDTSLTAVDYSSMVSQSVAMF